MQMAWPFRQYVISRSRRDGVPAVSMRLDDYVDWCGAKPMTFSRLKPSPRTGLPG